MSVETENSPLEITGMTKLVRLIGAGLLVVSASTFMIQQWELGNDLMRYLTLLGHTLLLAAAGFFLGIKMHESRGARTFFGLVLTSIPVHFAVLGGLVYSQFALDGADGAVPMHAMWTAKSPGEAIGLLALGAALLAPATAIAMTTFARPHAKALTLGYLILNLTLLVPLRGPTAAGAVAMGAAMLFAFIQRRYFWRQTLLQNVEGRFARLMLFAPVGVLIGRSLYLYTFSAYGFGMVLLGAALVAFIAATEQEGVPPLAIAIQVASATLAAVGWAFIAGGIIVLEALPTAAAIPIAVLPMGVILSAVSFQASKGAKVYRRCAALMVVSAMHLNLFIYGGGAAGLGCLLVGVAILVFGIAVKQKLVVIAGGAAIGVGTAYHLHHMVRVETLSHWAVLSVVGVALIVGASIFERRAAQTVRYLVAFRKQLAAWDF